MSGLPPFRPDSGELPNGIVPCGYCALPISAADAGTWSASGSDLIRACHPDPPQGCLRALSARVEGLDQQIAKRRADSDFMRRIARLKDTHADALDALADGDR